MVDILSWIACAGSFFVTLYLIGSRGLLEGGRPAWLIVLLIVPSWMHLPVNVIHVDSRSLCVLAILIGFLRQPYNTTRPNRWYGSDFCILAIVVAMTISQFAARSVAPLAPFDPFREMAFPYVIGRLFLQTARDIESILPVVCRCIMFLAAYALFEAVTKINPIEIPFGRTWGKGSEELDSVRWGLKRSYGLQTHPIYFGLTFAMMLPWAIEAAMQAWQGKGPRWWQLVPAAALVGVVCTGSRAAQVCSILVIATMIFHAVPRLRPAALLLVALGGIFIYVARDEIIQVLANYVNEGKSNETMVKINGIDYEYSGTKHRDLLDIVYADAIDQAGWLGFGNMLIRMPRDETMDERFFSIDNHWLLFYLHYGYLGLAVFILFSVCVMWNFLPPFLGKTGPTGRIAAGLLGAVGGCLMAMRSVWFAPDYACVWLFCAGLSVSLSRLYAESRTSGATNLV